MNSTQPLDLNQFEGHTPGPWRIVSERANDGMGAPVLSEIRGGNNQVAVRLGTLYTDAQKKDADLIAVAPSLLALAKEQRARIAALEAQNERLREALFKIEQSAHPDANIPHTEYEWAMSLVEQARAALAESGE